MSIRYVQTFSRKAKRAAKIAFTEKDGLRKVAAIVAKQIGCAPRTRDDKKRPSRPLLNDIGAVEGIRLAREDDFAIAVPFDQPSTSLPDAVAVILHCFYPDVLTEAMSFIANIPCRADIFVSTDSSEKMDAIRKALAGYRNGGVEVRQFPNRGRDIAPKIVGFADVYARYEFFVHLHTKKSLHAGDEYHGWREYLFRSLLGSRDIVSSILTLLQRETVGVVFPATFKPVRRAMNWGYNFQTVNRLLSHYQISLNAEEHLVEFPSGSMFWGRSAALKPLLDLALTFDSFPEEQGQIDGTLAHAIERTILHFAEIAGYEWLRISAHPARGDKIVRVESEASLETSRLKIFKPVTLPLPGRGAGFFSASVAESARYCIYPSRSRRPRLNLLLPTINPAQIFGGIRTALDVFESLRISLGDQFDFRILVTDMDIQPSDLEPFPDYSYVAFGNDDHLQQNTIVDARLARLDRYLNVRAGDVFFATAWWTAFAAYQLLEDQRKLFHRSARLIYLIQDFEPNFYGWSSRWAAVEATYRRGDETIAIINSEELCSAILDDYAFADSFCLPYQMSSSIDNAIDLKERERLIIFYGRPSAHRNCFEMICDALLEWQRTDPVIAATWKIVSLGEHYDPALVAKIQNISIAGKLSLADYGAVLGKASVGISLMLSPHPSYPPLEMASAGLITIGNNYPGKDLRKRFPEMIICDPGRPHDLAKCLLQAIAQAEPRIGTKAERLTTLKLHTPASVLDPDAVADLVRKELGIKIQ